MNRTSGRKSDVRCGVGVAFRRDFGSSAFVIAVIPRKYPHHPGLDGARQKVKRAKVHLEAIKREIARVVGPDAYRVTVYAEDDGRKHLWRVDDLKDLDPAFPLWVGDCLHNFRSALDHVAYELVRTTPGLVPTARTIFPILVEQPKNPVFIAPHPGPHADAMEIVDEVQPYKGGGKTDSLAILNNLDITDKHHELLATAAAVEVPYFGTPSGVKVIDSRADGGAIKDGQVVMWAIISPPQPEGALDGHVGLTVKLADGLIPAPFGLSPSVEQVFDDIVRKVEYWVLPQFDWFFATH